MPLNPSAKIYLPFPTKGRSYISLLIGILLFPLVKCILPFPLARWVFIPIPLIGSPFIQPIRVPLTPPDKGGKGGLNTLIVLYSVFYVNILFIN